MSCLIIAAPRVEALARDAAAAEAIKTAVHQNSLRTDADKARDKYRRPEQVLTFLGIRPNMTVVENLPGSGWYTRILGPLLKEQGTYYAAQAAPERFLDTVPAEQRERFERTVTEWQRTFVEKNAPVTGERTRAFFYGRDPASPAGFPSASADAVLDFRSIHNLVAAGSERTDLMMREFFRVLKPGGTFGVIDHREDEDSPRTPVESGKKGMSNRVI